MSARQQQDRYGAAGPLHFRPRRGLVLAGGGARGFAHIGIIKALKEAGVPFDHLGGTSMGAIIAAGLAHEWDVAELTERMRRSSSPTIRSMISPSR